MVAVSILHTIFHCCLLPQPALPPVVTRPACCSSRTFSKLVAIRWRIQAWRSPTAWSESSWPSRYVVISQRAPPPPPPPPLPPNTFPLPLIPCKLNCLVTGALLKRAQSQGWYTSRMADYSFQGVSPLSHSMLRGLHIEHEGNTVTSALEISRPYPITIVRPRDASLGSCCGCTMKTNRPSPSGSCCFRLYLGASPGPARRLNQGYESRCW